MKKFVLALMAVVMCVTVMTGYCFASEQTEAAENQVGLANPWTESDMQGVLDATGFEMIAPENATDVTYSYMQKDGLAQMCYVLDDTNWVYRIQAAEELTDISGTAYEWTLEEEGTVSGRNAVYYSYCAPDDGTENDVQVVNWYDAVTGVTYSLSAVSADLDGMDIQAYAENLYVPLQGEATGDAEADREEAAENQVGLANPWTESDMQGVLDATGFEMIAPENATDVTYSYMQKDGLAQMRYVLDETEWIYRIQVAEELTDISGMAYEWTLEEEGTVSGRNAVYYSYCAPDGGTENDVQVVNWYDAVTGVTYSLSAVSADLDGMDIQAYAENLYVPLQGEATGDTEADRESELKEYFLGEHKRSYDSSALVLSDNNDGTFAVSINVTGLCSLEDGVGTFEDHKMSFEIDDPNGDKMSGVIYRDNDDTLTVKITDSTWTYLKNDDVLEGFGK